MKWIIYSLLLVNIAVGVWHFRMPLLNAAVTPYQPSSGSEPQLILLSERDEQGKNLQGQCFSLGPFSSSSKSAQAAKLLAGYGIKATPLKSNERVREGFWVMLPPAENREQARKTIEELKQKGEKEFFLVVTGEQVNAISLGVFAKTESAQRRLAQVTRLGFKPIVETVDLPNTDYWLQWPRVEGEKLSDARLAQLREQNPEIGITGKSCETKG